MNLQRILLISLLFTAFHANAQSPINKGDKQLSAGLGFSEWGIPIFATYEQCVTQDLTVGGDFSYRSYNERWDRNDWKHHVVGVAGIVNYHFTRLLDIPTNIDLYAGANIGFVFYDTYDGPDDLDYDGGSVSGLGLGIQVGGRYYFNDKVGIMLQLGGGNTAANGRIGASFRL